MGLGPWSQESCGTIASTHVLWVGWRWHHPLLLSMFPLRQWTRLCLALCKVCTRTDVAVHML